MTISADEQERMYCMTASQHAAGVVTGWGVALIRFGLIRIADCFESVFPASIFSNAAGTDSL
jgi:hypothetical protein